MFHIRLTNPEYLSSEKLITFSKQRLHEHILVEEGADANDKQTHNHLHGKTFHKNDQAYRREVKKWFPNLSGNKDYHLKKGDPRGYVYVCKGTSRDWDTGKPKVLSTTFSEEKIKEFHKEYWGKQDEVIKVDMTVLEEPKKKVKCKTFMQKLIEEVILNHPEKTWDIDQEQDLNYLTDKLYTSMGHAGKNLDNFIWIRMLNALYLGLPKTYEVFEREKTNLKTVFRRSREH